MRDWIRESYRRNPRRYGRTWVGLIWFGLASVNILFGILASRTFGLNFEHTLIFTGLALPPLIPAGCLHLWATRRERRELLDWAEGGGGRTPAERAELLKLALGLPLRVAMAGLAGMIVFTGPVFFASILVLDSEFGIQDLALGVGGGLFGTLYSVAYMYVVADMGLRPLREDLNATVSRASVGRIRAPSLWSKLLIGLSIGAPLLGFCVGIVIADPDSSFGEGLTIVAVAFGGAIFFAATLVIPFGWNALTPIDDLIAGTRSIAAGELEARVPVTSTDEFAELVLSFNEMAEGLEDREALRGDLQASRARIVSSSDEARRKVERDLHDGAQQHLVLLKLKLGLMREALEADPVRARATLEEAETDLGRALDELRDLAHGIYPTVLTSDGLPAALAEAVASAPMPARLEANGTHRYRPELEAAVYFCCLEALQNAGKHAGDGAAVTVRLSEADGELRFAVADDGAGFDSSTNGDSAGLQNMADRIGALGGQLTVTSEPGAGTTVSGSIPVGG